jgi:hypothetical protein
LKNKKYQDNYQPNRLKIRKIRKSEKLKLPKIIYLKKQKSNNKSKNKFKLQELLVLKEEWSQKKIFHLKRKIRSHQFQVEVPKFLFN